MDYETVRTYVNQYCHLRDVQFAAYELYARKHGLTAKELFVLDIIWFAPDGCLQSEICDRMSATKQTISAIIKKFWKQGYVSLTESPLMSRALLFPRPHGRTISSISSGVAFASASISGYFA